MEKWEQSSQNSFKTLQTIVFLDKMTRTQTLPKQITSSVERDDTIISMVKKNMSEHGSHKT